MVSFESIFSWFRAPQKFWMYNGIRIPSGYIPLDVWQKKHYSEQVNGNSIRVFEGKYTFVFDKENKDYQLFLEQCKEDTKNLRKEFTKELKTRDLPLRGTQSRVGVNVKANTFSVSFLIRPPFFASQEDKSEENRWQGKGLDFVLHFDEDHRFHTARFMWNGFSRLSVFKHDAIKDLNNAAQALSGSYGDWPLMAKILADILEKYVEYLDYEKVA